MARNNSDIQRRFDGKSVYSSNVLEPIPVSDQDIYIIADETTKLDSLALKYYRDSRLWWVIAKANNLGKGGYSVKSGTQIRIPLSIERFI